MNVFYFWIACSLVALFIGVIGIVRTRTLWLSLVFTYFISQPFSWTMIVIGNQGGSTIAPAPDLLAIKLFIDGRVKYHFYENAINACIPPSPISSVVMFIVVFYIARQSKRVVCHSVFRS